MTDNMTENHKFFCGLLAGFENDSDYIWKKGYCHPDEFWDLVEMYERDDITDQDWEDHHLTYFRP